VKEYKDSTKRKGEWHNIQRKLMPAFEKLFVNGLTQEISDSSSNDLSQHMCCFSITEAH
jgi:hypothetical protein